MASALETAVEANRIACSYANGPDACAGRNRCLCVAMARLARRMRSDADRLGDRGGPATAEPVSPDDRATPAAVAQGRPSLAPALQS